MLTLGSGEFWDQSSSQEQDCQRSSQADAHQDPHTSHRSELGNGPQVPKSLWETTYPNMVEPSQELLDLKNSRLENPGIKVTSPDLKGPASGLQPQVTVQPQDVFQAPKDGRDRRVPLDHVLLSPIGTNSAASPKRSQLRTPLGRAYQKSTPPPGKAARQNEVSAADATITQVIRTALAGTHNLDPNQDRVEPQEMERNASSEQKHSPGRSWPSGTNPAKPSEGQSHGRSNATEEQPTLDQKAIEFLKTLQENGYIVLKDPSQSPKPQNLGSAASNKSERQTICQVCHKFKGRPCEVKYVLMQIYITL